MTQEQIIALELVLDLAENGADFEQENNSEQDNEANWNSIWLIQSYLIEQRTLASLQARINAL